MTKKILSIVLALVMVLAMGTVALVSVSADLADLPEKAEGTYRYYFYMPEDWKNEFTAETGNTAGAYIWEGDLKTSGWPGDPITPADVDGVYYVDCPTTTTAIVFNNYLDGGQDISEPRYSAAIQTINIGTEYYEAGGEGYEPENPYYPDGTENFDGMIFVTDYSEIDYSDYSKKMIIGGTWFYYYGNGEYGTSKVKGESEVMSDPHLHMEIPLPIDTGSGIETEGPTETVPSEVPSESVTTAPTPTETTTTPVVEPDKCDTDITVGGEVKSACVGDTITYTINLTAAELFEDFQAIVTYDSTMLELVRKTDDEEFGEDEIACPNLDGLIFNADIDGLVKFNATKYKGMNFKEEKVLITLDFVVKAEGETAISTLIEEMTVKGAESSYFTGGQQVIFDGITVDEVLTVPVHEWPTAPTTTAPKATETVKTTATATEAPKPTATATATATETVAQPGTNPTNVVGTTGANNGGTVGTGAAAYIYIAIAIMAMAACAVVVLRKKANG